MQVRRNEVTLSVIAAVAFHQRMAQRRKYRQRPMKSTNKG
jgi:hypothetical protein